MGVFFEVEYRCTKCKKALKLFDYDVIEVGGSEKEINLEKYPCPKCGKYSLYEGGTVSILWD
jgi:DNA-directed RNA polymerase subunit RPC12/RpoP